MTMTISHAFAWGAAGVGLGLVALWVVQLRTRDAGISDVGWAAGIGLLAVWFALVLDVGWESRRWLVAALAGAWSFRLAGYLLADRVVKGDEDGRWARLRRRWGRVAPAGFLGVFLVQAALAVLLSLFPLLAMLPEETSLRVRDVAGAVILVVSIVGESLADRRLAGFRGDPTNAGKVCREGMWRYSRHPNYFFEWLHWWAYPVIAIGGPWGWASLAGPAIMLAFLWKISGIAATERHALESRGEAYRRYIETTSAFVPWPPADEA